jgi:hypothetical protein
VPAHPASKQLLVGLELQACGFTLCVGAPSSPHLAQATNYKPFDFKKEEPFFAIQRRLLPNGM